MVCCASDDADDPFPCPALLIPYIAAKSGIIQPEIPTLNGSKCANEHYSGSFRQPDSALEVECFSASEHEARHVLRLAVLGSPDDSFKTLRRGPEIPFRRLVPVLSSCPWVDARAASARLRM